MLELPEVIKLSQQLNDTVVGKTIRTVLPPTKQHKFCWFNGDPKDYNDKIVGSKVSRIDSFGFFVEFVFSNGMKLCIDDGINLRFMNKKQTPANFQLLLEFDDDTFLVFTVSMYGGIVLHDGNYTKEHYVKSLNSVSPLSPEFSDYYQKMFVVSKQTLSVKAFLATEQRFPGIGNGVLQDILFKARIHPKQKIGSLAPDEVGKLRDCIVSVLTEMTLNGGRDTEKDIFGNEGGYATMLSSKTYPCDCPRCGAPIVKEAYMGGSVYYCPECQVLKK